MQKPYHKDLLVALCMALGMVGFFCFLLRPAEFSYKVTRNLGNGFSFGDDLYSIWLTTGGLFGEHEDPYGPQMTVKIQEGLYGREMEPDNPSDAPATYRTFAYPLYTDYLMIPFMRMPFAYVRVVFAILWPLALGLTLYLWLRVIGWRPSSREAILLVLFTLSWYPALAAFYAGQMGVLVGLFVAAAAFAARTEKFGRAGFLLSLSTIKAQVSVLVILGLLFWCFCSWRNRRPLVAGFFLSTILLWASGEWAQRGWLAAWWHVLRGYGKYTAPPLTQFLFGHWCGMFVSFGLWVLLMVRWWHIRNASSSSSPFVGCVAVTLIVTTVTILPTHAFYDHVVLLPAVLLVWRSQENLKSSVPAKIMFFTTGLTLLWPWAAALGVDLVAIALTRDWIGRHLFVLRIPLYPVVIFPFVLLTLMWLARRKTGAGSIDSGQVEAAESHVSWAQS